jgi:hypothetical protein
VPEALVSSASTIRAFLFTIRMCPIKQSLASGSVVDLCVSLSRFSLWKPALALGAWIRHVLAPEALHGCLASMSVPSTEK